CLAASLHGCAPLARWHWPAGAPRGLCLFSLSLGEFRPAPRFPIKGRAPVRGADLARVLPVILALGRGPFLICSLTFNGAARRTRRREPAGLAGRGEETPLPFVPASATRMVSLCVLVSTGSSARGGCVEFGIS
ncbi:unnamed protein product, partial [Amoebophrya sp. A120]